MQNVVFGAREVEVVPGEDATLLVDKAQRNRIEVDIAIEPEVTAPVSRGQRMGTMTIRSGEQVLRQIPLVAKEEIPKLTFGQLFMKILRQVAMAKTA